MPFIPNNPQDSELGLWLADQFERFEEYLKDNMRDAAYEVTLADEEMGSFIPPERNGLVVITTLTDTDHSGLLLYNYPGQLLTLAHGTELVLDEDVNAKTNVYLSTDLRLKIKNRSGASLDYSVRFL